MARPLEYNRRGQKTLRVYVDEAVKKRYLKLLIDEESTIQEDLEHFITWRLQQRKGGNL